MKLAVLSLSLLLLPAPLLAQARIAGPMTHDLPVRAASAAEAHVVPELAMRRARGSRIGLITGGVIGAAFGTYMGMASCSFNDDDQEKCTLRMPLFGLAGAVVVGGLGSVLGRLVGGS